MGTQRSPTLDLHSVFGISKAVSLGKVYKSLIKWHPDKNSPGLIEGKKEEELIISDPIVPAGFEHNRLRKNEELLLSCQSILSRSTSTRSKTPTGCRRSLSRNSSRRCTTPTPKSSYRSSETEFAPASLQNQKSLSRNSSRRCKTPTPKSSSRSSETESTPASQPKLRSLSRNSSRKSTTPTRKSSSRSSETESTPASQPKLRSLSRNSSRKSTTPTRKSSSRSSETESTPASPPKLRSLSRNSSRRCTTPTPKSSYRSSDTESTQASPLKLRSLSRNTSRRCTTPTPKSSYLSSETESTPASLSRNMSRKRSKTPNRGASPSRNMSKRCSSETEILDCHSPINMARNYSSESETCRPSLSRNISCKGSTPIIFSQTTVRRKHPPVEKKLECTLEELCFGGVKKVQYTRDIILNPGILAQEEEILMIEIKPGWRKGTKIRFEEKGDEKPGYHPADIVFLIEEKQHPLFKRDGDNLELVLEIPLVNALTGCTIPVPILGGETMTLSLEDTIICHGYEKIIPGQGMLNSKHDERRGDLHVRFLVNFPTELSDQQREEAVSFLQDCY
ncbi:hypothetical protein L6164_036211 [Bauhinia variegata]|uniref:Uncharacterized protein n=1 Tax=Bauhinia variegata TaxID=167791 RepID=A0ACB9KGE6_BAUVA|nr:hypothetical protein L6164_036211 [Bauhinia variegata]